MKNFLRSEKLIYVIVALVFVISFIAVQLKTRQKLDSLSNAVPVVFYSAQTESNEIKKVYVTPSGRKYHLDGCDYLSEKKMEISLTDALDSGYDPCAYCKP